MPELQFDEATHTYTFDGNRVAGVTETIKPLAPDYDAFPSYEARERGTLVHALTAVMDGREDLWPEMPEGREDELSGYCDAWHKFKTEAGVCIYPDFIERQLYHPIHKYAGTVDRVVRYRQHDYVLDIKTGAHDSSHLLQLAAYQEAYNSLDTKDKAGSSWYADGAMGVYLRANGEYRLRVYHQLRGAFTVFLALRSIAEWKKEHGPATEPDVIDDWVPLADDEEFIL